MRSVEKPIDGSEPEFVTNVSDQKYLNLQGIKARCPADVYILFGARSNGKTYGVQDAVLENYRRNKEQFVLIRTLEDNVKGKYSLRYFGGDIARKYRETTSFEKDISYYGGVFRSDWFNDDIGKVQHDTMGYTMSVSGWQKYKSQNYDDVTSIIYEEFNEKCLVLSQEEIIAGWENNLSTIIRKRDNVTVYILGNSNDRKNPIFTYYGINTERLEQGYIYQFETAQGLKICIYWVADLHAGQEKQINKHISVYESEVSKMIQSGQFVEDIPVMEYAGKGYQEYLNESNYKNRYYCPDYKTTIHIPTKSTLPAILTRGKYPGARVEELPELLAHNSLIKKYLLYVYYNDKLITDGKCRDLIRQISRRFIDINNI